MKLGFKATNQRPALQVPRAVNTSSSQLVPPRAGIPHSKENLHNGAAFSGNLLFSLTPSRRVLLSWIIFSNYLFRCGGGGNIDGKMAPSYSILLFPVCLTHTCWQEEPQLLPSLRSWGRILTCPCPPYHHEDCQLSSDLKTKKKRERNKATPQTFITQQVTRGRERLNSPVSRGENRAGSWKATFWLVKQQLTWPQRFLCKEERQAHLSVFNLPTEDFLVPGWTVHVMTFIWEMFTVPVLLPLAARRAQE